jgi:hypothetical protein
MKSSMTVVHSDSLGRCWGRWRTSPCASVGSVNRQEGRRQRHAIAQSLHLLRPSGQMMKDCGVSTGSGGDTGNGALTAHGRRRSSSFQGTCHPALENQKRSAACSKPDDTMQMTGRCKTHLFRRHFCSIPRHDSLPVSPLSPLPAESCSSDRARSRFASLRLSLSCAQTRP